MNTLLIDLDKTLIHDIRVEPLLIKLISEKCGCDTEVARNLLKDFFNLQMQNSHYLHSFAKVGLWKSVLKKYEIPYTPEFIFTISKEFWELIAHNVQPYEGVLQTLEILKTTKNYKIVIVSGGDFYSRFMQIKSTGLLNLVDSLVTSEDTGIQKDKENLYLKAIEELNIKIDDCLVIGDNEIADIVLPKKDGFKTVKISGDKENTVADYYLDEFKDILDLI